LAIFKDKPCNQCPHPLSSSDAVREQKKKYFRGSFQFIIVTIKKYQPSEYLKCDNLGIFQSSKLRTLVEKILPISLKRNFDRNTLGYYGLI